MPCYLSFLKNYERKNKKQSLHLLTDEKKDAILLLALFISLFIISFVFVLFFHVYKVSAQPGSQRCPVPAIRYSRGDALPRVVVCIAALSKWC